MSEQPVQPCSAPASRANVSSRLSTTLSKNMVLGLARVAVNSVVALALPAYLTHHLSVNVYAAWILIIQLATFVSFLDFGIQTAISKFVAEHHAKDDLRTAGNYASAGLSLMGSSALVGLILIGGLAWQVPRLFHAMPSTLYNEVRLSLVIVGVSLCFGLLCSVFSAVFLGLQRYAIPIGVAMLNRIIFTVAILIAVRLKAELTTMAIIVAIINISTACLQFIAWRRSASHISVSFARVDSTVRRQMTSYCFLLSVWSIGMLCVNGLDLTVVGHYDFGQTAYYSVSTLPVNFMIVIIAALIGPMMPASSALSTQRTPLQMGTLLVRLTRYSTLLLLLTSLPLTIYGYSLLLLWVGPIYATHSLIYLRILVFGNIIRQLSAPFAAMAAATNKLRAATAAAIAEAVANLTCSLWLARRVGAVGVAWGTVIGAIISLVLHLTISMNRTRQTLDVSSGRFIRTGLLRPLCIAVPSILLLCVRGFSPFSAGEGAIWVLSTLITAWYVGLVRQEREHLEHFVRESLRRRIVTTS